MGISGTYWSMYTTSAAGLCLFGVEGRAHLPYSRICCCWGCTEVAKWRYTPAVVRAHRVDPAGHPSTPVQCKDLPTPGDSQRGALKNLMPHDAKAFARFMNAFPEELRPKQQTAGHACSLRSPSKEIKRCSSDKGTTTLAQESHL